VGAAIYPFDGSDTESLIAEADRRMYRLKNESKALPVLVGAQCDDLEMASEGPLPVLVSAQSAD
jgi:hypothetical protein